MFFKRFLLWIFLISGLFFVRIKSDNIALSSIDKSSVSSPTKLPIDENLKSPLSNVPIELKNSESSVYDSKTASSTLSELKSNVNSKDFEKSSEKPSIVLEKLADHSISSPTHNLNDNFEEKFDHSPATSDMKPSLENPAEVTNSIKELQQVKSVLSNDNPSKISETSSLNEKDFHAKETSAPPSSGNENVKVESLSPPSLPSPTASGASSYSSPFTDELIVQEKPSSKKPPIIIKTSLQKGMSGVTPTSDSNSRSSRSTSSSKRNLDKKSKKYTKDPTGEIFDEGDENESIEDFIRRHNASLEEDGGGKMKDTTADIKEGRRRNKNPDENMKKKPDSNNLMRQPKQDPSSYVDDYDNDFEEDDEESHKIEKRKVEVPQRKNSQYKYDKSEKEHQQLTSSSSSSNNKRNPQQQAPSKSGIPKTLEDKLKKERRDTGYDFASHAKGGLKRPLSSLSKRKSPKKSHHEPEKLDGRRQPKYPRQSSGTSHHVVNHDELSRENWRSNYYNHQDHPPIEAAYSNLKHSSNHHREAFEVDEYSRKPRTSVSNRRRQYPPNAKSRQLEDLKGTLSALEKEAEEEERILGYVNDEEEKQQPLSRQTNQNLEYDSPHSHQYHQPSNHEFQQYPQQQQQQQQYEQPPPSPTQYVSGRDHHDQWQQQRHHRHAGSGDYDHHHHYDQHNKGKLQSPPAPNPFPSHHFENNNHGYPLPTNGYHQPPPPPTTSSSIPPSPPLNQIRTQHHQYQYPDEQNRQQYPNPPQYQQQRPPQYQQQQQHQPPYYVYNSLPPTPPSQFQSQTHHPHSHQQPNENYYYRQQDSPQYPLPQHQSSSIMTHHQPPPSYQQQQYESSQSHHEYPSTGDSNFNIQHDEL